MSEHSDIEWTDATWNPVRGCTKITPGCDHCLAPETPVLYADLIWRPIGDVQPGHVLVGFDEYAPQGQRRKLRASVVEKAWWSKQPGLRLVTEQTEVITTASHRWLRHKADNWPRTLALRAGKPLRQIGVTVQLPVLDNGSRLAAIAEVEAIHSAFPAIP